MMKPYQYLSIKGISKSEVEIEPKAVVFEPQDIFHAQEVQINITLEYYSNRVIHPDTFDLSSIYINDSVESCKFNISEHQYNEMEQKNIYNISGTYSNPYIDPYPKKGFFNIRNNEVDVLNLDLPISVKPPKNLFIRPFPILANQIEKLPIQLGGGNISQYQIKRVYLNNSNSGSKMSFEQDGKSITINGLTQNDIRDSWIEIVVENENESKAHINIPVINTDKAIGN